MMIRPSKIAILSILLITHFSNAADDCSPGIIHRIFNYPRYALGLLPKEIKVERLSAMPQDREVWNQSLRSGETAIAEIYSRSGKLLSRSKMVTSNLYTRVEEKDHSKTYFDAIELAYKNCDDLENCTLRLVHTHPPTDFGEDLRFSRNDIRSSYEIKVLLEKIGVKVHMREDIIVSDRRGGIYLYSYTLPKNFTYESGHYWPGSFILKQLKKNPDVLAAYPDAIKAMHKESADQFRKAIGATTASRELSPKFVDLLHRVDEKERTLVAVVNPSDTQFERPHLGVLDSDQAPIAEITLALTHPDQFLPDLKRAEASKTELTLFLYGNDFDTEESIFAIAFDLRAILNKMNFKQALSVHYQHKGTHYQLTLTENDNTRNGVTYISKAGQAVRDAINFTLDRL